MRVSWGFALILASSLSGMASWSFALPEKTATEEQLATLQRGARVFMNYCSGCHSLKYLRYNQMAKGLGLTTFDGDVDKPLMYSNLVFTRAALHEPIHIALRPEDALQWFGAVPPDLSLLVRQRGVVWLSQYLKSFYRDYARPLGSNNLLSPMVAMPNVLEMLSGVQRLAPDGRLQAQSNGLMTPTEFDALVSDLAAFLTYVSEPEKAFRQYVGYFVFGFLGLLVAVLYLLKREIWRALAKNSGP